MLPVHSLSFPLSSLLSIDCLPSLYLSSVHCFFHYHYSFCPQFIHRLLRYQGFRLSGQTYKLFFHRLVRLLQMATLHFLTKSIPITSVYVLWICWWIKYTERIPEADIFSSLARHEWTNQYLYTSDVNMSSITGYSVNLTNRNFIYWVPKPRELLEERVSNFHPKRM